MLPPNYAELTSAPIFARGHEGSLGRGGAPSFPKRLSVSLTLKAVWGRTLALRMMALRVGIDTPALLASSVRLPPRRAGQADLFRIEHDQEAARCDLHLRDEFF
jgi:hypothetical protein